MTPTDYLTTLQTAPERQADVTDAGKALEDFEKLHTFGNRMYSAAHLVSNETRQKIRTSLKTSDKVEGLVKAITDYREKLQAFANDGEIRNKIDFDAAEQMLDKLLAAFRKDKP